MKKRTGDGENGEEPIPLPEVGGKGKKATRVINIRVSGNGFSERQWTSILGELRTIIDGIGQVRRLPKTATKRRRKG